MKNLLTGMLRRFQQRRLRRHLDALDFAIQHSEEQIRFHRAQLDLLFQDQDATQAELELLQFPGLALRHRAPGAIDHELVISARQSGA